ncbi:MAG: TfoX/Sxy family protein [Deinococcota bacterium]
MTEFVETLVTRLAPMGSVRAKSMFGGYGIFKDELMFALVANDIVHFKVDNDNRADFEAADGEPFMYVKNGKAMPMSYWRVPTSTLEDDDALLLWAHKGYEAALRKPRKKSKKARG